jgi:glycosyltransferase involved in cell wall biosynthesis
MSRADAAAILTVNASVAGGGAERVATTLHEEYVRRGLDAWYAVGCLNAEAPRAFEIPNDEGRGPWARAFAKAGRRVSPASSRPGAPAWYASRLLRVLGEPGRYARVMRGCEDFDFPQTSRLLELAPEFPDVLHLHNLHGGYFDIRALPALSSAVPTVLTLHDTWLLTGHCANPLGCERWREGCGDCPALDLYVPLRADQSAGNLRVKREALLRSRVALAAPSAWMLGVVEGSGVLEGGRIEARIVPNGVDTRVFRPGDRAAARAELGLPADRAVVTFAARSPVDNPFKDFATLEDAMARVGAVRDDVLFVALGGERGEATSADATTLFVPFVADPVRVARYFQASDLYVHSTRAESFGLVVAEAMACGTAVVATRAGAVPELVADGVTGVLVDQGDAEGLAAAVAGLLDDGDRRRSMARAGAELVALRFTLTHEADSYLAWYAELLERRAGESA